MIFQKFEENDLIYVSSQDNKYKNKIMVCVESRPEKAYFRIYEEQSWHIILEQTQESLDKVGKRISKENNPEYFL